MDKENEALVKANTLVLANAAALGAAIISEMSSGYVANAINGQKTTRYILETAILNELVKR